MGRWTAVPRAVIIESVVSANDTDGLRVGSLFGRTRAEVEHALPDREDVPCPSCRTRPHLFGVDFQGLHLARCSTCGLEFQSPRPVFEQLSDAVYGAAYHPPEQAIVDAVREWQYTRQLNRLDVSLPRHRRKVLDVGCGTGAFIGYASRLGWTVDGSDVVVTNWARQTGARVWEGQLPDVDFGSVRYDVVRFNQVLEHTQDPLAELRRARELVSTGGVLMIGVPNMAGLSIRLKTWQSRLGFKRQPWKHYGALHHLWFFTPRTLRRLVEAASFQVLRWETPITPRPGRPPWVTSLVRSPMELTRCGGTLELYARARS